MQFYRDTSLMLYFSSLQVKCDQYWPTRGTETYGLIQVTLLDTVELATYCVRTFALFKVRTCVHIGYLNVLKCVAH